MPDDVLAERVPTSVAQACVTQITVNLRSNHHLLISITSAQEAAMNMMVLRALRMAMIAFILWCILTTLLAELPGLF
jgi:hypothetical protein